MAASQKKILIRHEHEETLVREQEPNSGSASSGSLEARCQPVGVEFAALPTKFAESVLERLILTVFLTRT